MIHIHDIHKGKPKNIERLMDFSVLLYFASSFTLSQPAVVFLQSVATLSFLFISVIYLINKRFIHLGFYSGWALIFLCMSLFSYFYAIDQRWTLDMLIQIGRYIIFGWILTQYIDSREKMLRIIRYIFYAGFTMCLVLIVTEWKHIGTDRLGINEFNLHSNVVGFFAIFSILSGLFYTLKEKKMWYIPPILFMLTIIILTGSRKSLVIALVSILLLIMMFSKPRWRIISLAAAGLLPFIVFYLINNIPFLYNIMGTRLFMYNKYVQVSDLQRLSMLQHGMEYISIHPLFGFGLSNFAFMFQKSTSTFFYSHNTFIELLTGIGLIGFIIYFSIYIYIIIGLIKANPFDRSLHHLISIMFLALFVLDFGLVTYQYKITYIIWPILVGYNRIALLSKEQATKDPNYQSDLNEGYRQLW